MVPGEPISEDDLIARYFAPLAGEGGLGLRDDAASLAAPADADLVITADALVAGVHFFAEDPPDAIARKALRVNLSDLAAKGAQPMGFLLTLALAAPWSPAWLEAFAAGLGDDALAYSCPLLGGDTVHTPGPLSISITALGAVPRGRMVPRTGARPGDLIAVTGSIGDAALGLLQRTIPAAPWIAGLGEAERDHLLDRYRLPQPRSALAGALRDHAHSSMDVSDGLVGDLEKMLRVSGVSGSVTLDAVPLSPAARRAIAADPRLLEVALTGGDDYEILCSVGPQQIEGLTAAAQAIGLPLTVIGRVVEGTDRAEFTYLGAPLSFARRSYSHF
jgi:thiamine-monophosphate kinase